MGTYISKMFVGFAGVKTGIYYSLEKGKRFDAVDGDIPSEYADLIETASMDMSKVETPEAPKRTRKPKS